jgi:hypothetical protein
MGTVNFPSRSEDLLETASKRGQFARGFKGEAMKIWQFAVLVLILAYGIYLAAWVYTGIGREIELITKYQVR